MMKPQNLKWIIIFSIILALGAMSLHWYLQYREASLKDDISHKEGVIEQLEKRSTEDSLDGIKYQKTIDSAKATIRLSDTIVINRNHIVEVNRVKALSTDSLIEFLRSRIN